jgi:hypothetical protein
MAEDARRMPSREPEFRNLILNQRVEMNSPFISRSVWHPAAAKFQMIGAERRSIPASICRRRTTSPAMCRSLGSTDAWETKPTFWLPARACGKSSNSDRVPYDVWAR